MMALADASMPGPDEHDDLDVLLSRAAAGDEQALADLYDRTSRRVFGMALSVLRDRAAAEEATLDVFTQVWKRNAPFDRARGSALSYLLLLARTRSIDILRTRARRADYEEAPPAVFDLTDHAPGPEEVHGAGERAALVRAALATLPLEQRRAIEAAYFGGMSHSEVAAACGAPLGTVKTRIRDGLIALRRSLGTTERFA